MIAGTVLFASATYLLMLASFYMSRFRKFHIPVMASIIVIDVCFPFYLFMTRDWGRRLIDEEEILSSLIWMHLMVVITLYVLYVMQVLAARAMLRGEMELRESHKNQGIGILVTRALVIMTGALLVEGESA